MGGGGRSRGVGSAYLSLTVCVCACARGRVRECTGRVAGEASAECATRVECGAARRPPRFPPRRRRRRRLPPHFAPSPCHARHVHPPRCPGCPLLRHPGVHLGRKSLSLSLARSRARSRRVTSHSNLTRSASSHRHRPSRSRVRTSRPLRRVERSHCPPHARTRVASIPDTATTRPLRRGTKSSPRLIISYLAGLAGKYAGALFTAAAKAKYALPLPASPFRVPRIAATATDNISPFGAVWCAARCSRSSRT